MYFGVLDELPVGSSKGNSEFISYLLRVVLIPSVIKHTGELQENTAFDRGGMYSFI